MSNGITNSALTLLIIHLRGVISGCDISAKLDNIDIVNRHRIDAFFPLEYLENNSSEEFINYFRKKRKQKKIGGLRKLNVFKKLTSFLSSNGIDFIVIKGYPLNKLIFDDEERRVSRDIDVLVKKEDVKKVFDLLIEKGVYLITPDFPIKDSQWDFFLEEFDQMTFFLPGNRIPIEIHWKLFRNEAYLPISEEVLFNNKEEFTVGNIRFNSLKNSLHTLYISLHGAQHQWDSLVWITDMYMLHEKLSKKEITDSLDEAREYGVLDTYVLGFYMANLIFKMDLDPNIQEVFNKDIKRIAHESLKFLQRTSSTAGSSKEVLKRMRYSLKIQRTFKGKMHHFYNFPMYSLKHQSSRRKFIHWSTRPISQIKEKRSKSKN